MPLISLIVILVLVGVGLWCVNTFLAEYMDAKILKILNVAVVIGVILWLLSVFGIFEGVGNIRIR